jgi:hypothetical protein
MSTESQEPAEFPGTPISPVPTGSDATLVGSQPVEADAQTLLPTEPVAAPSSEVSEPAAPVAFDAIAENVGDPEGNPSAEPDVADENPTEPESAEDHETSETTGDSGPRPEQTLEGIAAKAARRRLNARDEALALELARNTLLTGRPGVLRVLALAGSLPWVVLVNASASAWSGLKPTARAQFLKGIGTVPGEGFVRTRMSIIRGLWKADAGAASKAVSMLFKDFVDQATGLLPNREAVQFGNVFLGRGRPWIASADISSLKAAEQETVRLGIFSACVQTPQAPPVVIYAMRSLVEAQLTDRLTPQQRECGERAVAKLSSKWQRTLLEEVPGLPEVFKARINARTEQSGTSDAPEGASRNASGEANDGDADAPQEGADDGSSSSSSNGDARAESGSGDARRERPVYVSKTIPAKGEARPEERRADDRRTEEREVREDRSRRGREPVQEPRKAAGPFNPAEALRQLDSYIQGLRIELNAAQVRLRQRDEDTRRKRPERRSSSVPGDQSAEELYRQVRQLELRNAELQAQIEEFRASSEVRGVSRGLIDGSVPDDAAAEMRRALSVTLKDDFEDFEALKRDAKDVVVQRYFGSLLQHIFEVLRDEGVVFEGLSPGVETKEQIIESQAALKSVDIVPLVLDEPDDEDLEELDVLDAKAEDLEDPVSDPDAGEEDEHMDALDEPLDDPSAESEHSIDDLIQPEGHDALEPHVHEHHFTADEEGSAFGHDESVVPPEQISVEPSDLREIAPVEDQIVASTDESAPPEPAGDTHPDPVESETVTPPDSVPATTRRRSSSRGSASSK